MGRLFTAIGILIVFIFLSVNPVLAFTKTKFSETEFDFGFVPQENIISHTFWIKSGGPDTLKIVRVKPG